MTETGRNGCWPIGLSWRGYGSLCGCAIVSAGEDILNMHWVLIEHQSATIEQQASTIGHCDHRPWPSSNSCRCRIDIHHTPTTEAIVRTWLRRKNILCHQTLFFHLGSRGVAKNAMAWFLILGAKVTKEARVLGLQRIPREPVLVGRAIWRANYWYN